MILTHEPWLVALSLLVAFQGSYVGLHLARQVGAAQGLRRRALITAAAFSLALGIWTMHFVGMLAVRLPVAVDFLVLPTLLSFLVCVLVVGFAVFAASAGGAGGMRIALAGVFMGAGIVTMHYLGMLALHASLHMTHAPLFVLISVVMGVAASGIALWLCFGQGAGGILPAAAMTLAISAMHYSAMAGVTFHPNAVGGPVEMPAFSPGLLAIIVSVVAFLVSGLFLLTLIPEDRRETIVPEAMPAAAQAAAVDAATVHAAGATPDAPSIAASAEPDAPAREAPHGRTTEASTRTLPVEKEGLHRQLDVAHLVAVQAQAHYSQLFDGETLWFCPLSISEVEAALDPAVFARVHRSHIINLDRVSSLRNVADAAVIAMTARTPYRAPVSRSRRRWLKQRLEERPRSAT